MLDSLSTPSEQVYLSVEQVAARYNVSTDTIWRWRRQGDFPRSYRMGGRTVRWLLADLEAWESRLTACFMTHLPVGFWGASPGGDTPAPAR